MGRSRSPDDHDGYSSKRRRTHRDEERSHRHRSRSPLRRERDRELDRDRHRDRDRDRDRDRHRHRDERDRERDRKRPRAVSPTGSVDSRHSSRRGEDRDARRSKEEASRHSDGSRRRERHESSGRSNREEAPRTKDEAPAHKTTEPAQELEKPHKVPETLPVNPTKPAEPPAAPLAETGPPGETPEERKKRETRERLEAWKAKKAAQAAANGSKPATPTPSAPASPKPPAEPPKKAGFAKAKVGAALGPSKLGAPAKRLGLAASILPTGDTKKPSRAKASEFMLGGSDDETAPEAKMFIPEEQTAEERAAEEARLQEAAEAAEDESDDEDLFGDDEGDARARAEERREQAALALAKQSQDPDAPAEPKEEATAEASTVAEADGDVAMDDAPRNRKERSEPSAEAEPEKTEAMEVDQPEPTQAANAASAPEQAEDEEEDPLDAFMSGVTAEVQKVDAADTAVAGGATAAANPKKIKLTPLDMESESAGEEEPEQAPDETETVGLDAASIMALAQKKLKKRDVAVIDHAKIDYEPFRKAFYHPPPEVEAMSAEEAELLRLSLDGIKIRGVDCPKPVTKWSHCGLPATCLDVIKSNGYEAPTSIQAQAIPAIMSGRDVIGVAKTGSGKTVAFLLPLFRHIKDQRPLEPLEGPIGMIMTPTRELATQIHRECKPFLKALGLRATCLYGGSPLKDNIAEIKRGVEIVVCTPGRMIELLTTNSGKIISMRRITYLVLDEADRMFDMGFEPQVTKIIGQVRPDRQTVLFSATFPKQMEALARKILKKPLEITVGGRSVVAAEIEQIVEVREDDTKFKRLLELLGRYSNEDPEARVLVFVDRQDSVDELNRELIQHHYVVQGLHGGKDQVDRDQIISDFKAGVIPIVIATSVAARGLDVKQLKLVVNYDAPNHMEDYVHRAGRTGRAGNKGTCVTFITPEQDRYAVDLLRALEASKANVPDELRKMSEGFLAKVKAGIAKVGSGFGGKGLDRFDKDREATRKAERATFGEEEEKPEAVDSDEAADDSAKSNLPAIDVEIRRGPAPEAVRKGIATNPEKATGFDAMPMKMEGLTSFERAKLVAANLNATLREKRGAHNLNADDVRFGDGSGHNFHAVVPINDYPQKARWKVTNKETISSLVEVTGASITNKGIWYEKNKEPEPGGQPKLHLLIEAGEEAKVKRAISEIKRLLVEATTQALEAEQRAGIAGRYSL